MATRAKMPTSMVGDAHSYTRSSAPWMHDQLGDGASPRSGGVGGRLFRYLSGGGSKAFGRTVAQEEADIRQTRFLAWSAAAALLWLFFWI